MSHSLLFIVVEDRQNKTLSVCRESAALAQEPLVVLSRIDAGPAYERFCASYVHLSSNSPEFEKICFRRYFLLAQHLAAHPECQQFVLIDSDVLLLEGVGAHIARMVGKADFSGSYICPTDGWNPRQISPHVSYWTSSGLQCFVAFVLDTYATPTGRKKLCEIADRFAAKGVRGGVSDMTLLYLWARASGNFEPINRVLDGRVIDHNINIPHNHLSNEFRIRGGAKHIAYVDGRPSFRTPAGEVVSVLALHFQGSAKKVMSYALHRRVRTVAALTYALLTARRLRDGIFKISAVARKALDALRVVAPASK